MHPPQPAPDPPVEEAEGPVERDALVAAGQDRVAGLLQAGVDHPHPQRRRLDLPARPAADVEADAGFELPLGDGQIGTVGPPGGRTGIGQAEGVVELIGRHPALRSTGRRPPIDPRLGRQVPALAPDQQLVERVEHLPVAGQVAVAGGHEVGAVGIVAQVLVAEVVGDPTVAPGGDPEADRARRLDPGPVRGVAVVAGHEDEAVGPVGVAQTGPLAETVEVPAGSLPQRRARLGPAGEIEQAGVAGRVVRQGGIRRGEQLVDRREGADDLPDPVEVVDQVGGGQGLDHEVLAEGGGDDGERAVVGRAELDQPTGPVGQAPREVVGQVGPGHQASHRVADEVDRPVPGRVDAPLGEVGGQPLGGVGDRQAPVVGERDDVPVEGQAGQQGGVHRHQPGRLDPSVTRPVGPVQLQPGDPAPHDLPGAEPDQPTIDPQPGAHDPRHDHDRPRLALGLGRLGLPQATDEGLGCAADEVGDLLDGVLIEAGDRAPDQGDVTALQPDLDVGRRVGRPPGLPVDGAGPVGVEPGVDPLDHLLLLPQVAVADPVAAVEDQPIAGRHAEGVASGVDRAGGDHQVVADPVEHQIHQPVPDAAPTAVIRAGLIVGGQGPDGHLGRGFAVEPSQVGTRRVHGRQAGQGRQGRPQHPVLDHLEADPDRVGHRVVGHEGQDVDRHADELAEVLVVGQRRAAVRRGGEDHRPDGRQVRRPQGQQLAGNEPAPGVGQDVERFDVEAGQGLGQHLGVAPGPIRDAGMVEGQDPPPVAALEIVERAALEAEGLGGRAVGAVEEEQGRAASR